MAEYEVVREIQNSCANNQMRDVFFDEVETDDPVAYVRSLLGGELDELDVEEGADGAITVFTNSKGFRQKFLFTLI